MARVFRLYAYPHSQEEIRTMRRLFFLLAAVLMGATACASSGSQIGNGLDGGSTVVATAAPSQGAVQAGAPDPCAIFPLSLANQLFASKGEKLMAKVSSQSGKGAWYKSSCNFRNMSGLGLSITTYLDEPTGNPAWKVVRQNIEQLYKGLGEVRDLQGLGDQAYAVTLKGDIVGVAARLGRLIVFIGPMSQGDSPAVLNESELQQLVDAALHSYR
jgi:hypothetical protein